jgi:2-hydroxychromene-2-carboxylate isomerase
MPPEYDWYFDVLSPFAYLQWKQRQRFRDRVRLRPVPVVLGAILAHWGQKGPAEIAPKRLYTYRWCQWRADRLGIPFRFPPAHPFNPLPALRLLVAAGPTAEAVDMLFDAAFRDGLDLTATEVLEDLGKQLGLDEVARRIADPAVKARLRENTERAIALGIFGVPTTIVGTELFWGEDSTEMLLAFLAERSLFDAPEMRRLATLPSGIHRRAAERAD